MANKRLLSISKKLNEYDLNVMQNKDNGIICKGFYIFDKGDYYRVFKDNTYLDFNNGNSIVDLIKNNSIIESGV